MRHKKSSVTIFQEFLLVLTKVSFWEEHWALGYNSMKVWGFLELFGNFWGNLCVPCSWLIITLSCTCGERKIWSNIKKISKHFDHDCLQEINLPFMSLLIARIVSGSNWTPSLCYRSYSYQKCQTNQVLRSLGQIRNEKLFCETIMDKIYGKNPSFHVKYHTTGKVHFIFFRSFLLVLIKFSFWVEGWAIGFLKVWDFLDIS